MLNMPCRVSGDNLFLALFTKIHLQFVSPLERGVQGRLLDSRRLSPLQPVENQSRSWGIRGHLGTWGAGLTPAWTWSCKALGPRGLPGSVHLLSANGSHLAVCRRSKMVAMGTRRPPSGLRLCRRWALHRRGNMLCLR